MQPATCIERDAAARRMREESSKTSQFCVSFAAVCSGIMLAPNPSARRIILGGATARVAGRPKARFKLWAF
jgi:hypothetical protein